MTEQRIRLFDGIELFYVDTAAGCANVAADSASAATDSAGAAADASARGQKAAEPALQIHYCHAGQIVWNTEPGRNVFLNPGDFSVSARACPRGRYRGLILSVDLPKVSANPPALLAGTNAFDRSLYERLCREGGIAFFAGNEQSEGIFSGFYGKPKELALPYRRIKTLELFLYLTRLEAPTANPPASYTPEQVAMVRQIHTAFLQNMERRITIEDLSRQYLINPTTLKAAFKAVYGTSLAAHMKKHRMEQAAKLLRETDMCVADVAAAVGYESPSKFAAAFKNQFSVSPSVFRRGFLPGC